MRQYEEAALMIVEFTSADVITDSNDLGDIEL